MRPMRTMAYVLTALLIACNTDRTSQNPADGAGDAQHDDGAVVDAGATPDDGETIDVEDEPDTGALPVTDAELTDAEPVDTSAPDIALPDGDLPDGDLPDGGQPDGDLPDVDVSDVDSPEVDPATNACGGAAPLSWSDAHAVPGDPCHCGGILACDGPDALRCDVDACEPSAPRCDGIRTAVTSLAVCSDDLCQRTETIVTCGPDERCDAGSCVSCGCSETERCDDAGACVPGAADACTDGVDNDLNGSVDCNDSACDGRDGCVLAPLVAQVHVIDGRERIVLGRPGEAPVRLNAALNGDLATHPTWAPDGVRLAWATWDLGSMEQRLRIVDVTTGAVVDLDDDVLGCSVVAWPTWSPDGASMAFECVGETSRIDIIDLEALEVRTLVEDAAAPWWSHADPNIITWLAVAPTPVGVWETDLRGTSSNRRVDARMASRGIITRDGVIRYTRAATVDDGSETTIVLDATHAPNPARLESRRLDPGVRVLYYVGADGTDIALHERDVMASFAAVASRGGVVLAPGVVE